MEAHTATFGGLELVTSPFVMTPRETSTGLVVCATDHLEGRAGVVVDVGTGSGAIALAVAETAPQRSRLGDGRQLGCGEAGQTERAPGRAPRPRHRASREPARSVSGTADVIVANLPYLPIGERSSHPDLASEPVSAVFAEGDGLGLVRRLVAAARRRLSPDGLLALQIRGRIHAAPSSDLHALEHLLATPAPIAA